MNFREQQAKKNREKFTKLQAKTESKGKFQKDPRLWTPTTDKDGKAIATIRFLPVGVKEKGGDYVTQSHYFFTAHETGKKYIELCPSTIGEPDPVYDYNGTQWIEANRDVKSCPVNAGVRNRKKRFTNICNILVINDPGNPENNGKVFLFKFSKQIMDILDGVISPEDPDDEQINPFNMFGDDTDDMVGGANFKISVFKGDNNFNNYTKSKFMAKSDMDKDEEVMEEIYSKVYSLSEFVDPKIFKSYAELQQKLYMVLGISENSMRNERSESPATIKAKDEDEDEIPQPAVVEDEDEESDEALAEFKKELATAKKEE